MSSTHYILAKHVPDVFRKEPRNIGVIVWSEVGVAAQFWGVDAQGLLDKRQIPPFVISASAYEQWIKYWEAEICKPKVEFIGSGRFADVHSPAFLEAIQTGNTDTFFLQESGTVLEALSKEDLPKLAKELFESLVTSEAIDEPDTTALVKTECERMIKTTHLDENRHFKKFVTVMPTIKVGSVERILKLDFSYAFWNGSVQWLGQPVALKRYPTQLAKEVQSACYKFEKVIENDFVTRDRAASFIYPMDDQLDNKEVNDAIDLLKAYSNVVNLRDPRSARAEFEKVAALAKAH